MSFTHPRLDADARLCFAPNRSEATAAVKPILGPYYREPAPSPGPLPLHLIKPLARSFARDRCAEAPAPRGATGIDR